MRSPHAILPALLITVWVLAATGCSEESPARNSGSDVRLTVTASLPPHAWIASQIGGPQVNVITVLDDGASPAFFQPSDAAITAIRASDLFITAGVPFEFGPWAAAITDRSEERMLRLAPEGAAVCGACASGGHTHEHGNALAQADANGGSDATNAVTSIDPHAWTNPVNLSDYAGLIAQAFCDHDPEHAREYITRAAELQSRLDALATDITAKLAPFHGRSIVVFHPAWGWLLETHGLQQIAIETNGREPTDREITALQRHARAEGVRVVFTQPQISGRGAHAVAKAIDAQVVTIDPLAANPFENLPRVVEHFSSAWQ